MSNPALTVKQYDTYPGFTATLSDTQGPIDLTSATGVEFVMKGNSGAVVSGDCSITSPAGGVVTYVWGDDDLAAADTYQVEFVITWSEGEIQKVPNDSTQNPMIQVDADLNGADE